MFVFFLHVQFRQQLVDQRLKSFKIGVPADLQLDQFTVGIIAHIFDNDGIHHGVGNDQGRFLLGFKNGMPEGHLLDFAGKIAVLDDDRITDFKRLVNSQKETGNVVAESRLCRKTYRNSDDAGSAEQCISQVVKRCQFLNDQKQGKRVIDGSDRSVNVFVGRLLGRKAAVDPVDELSGNECQHPGCDQAESRFQQEKHKTVCEPHLFNICECHTYSIDQEKAMKKIGFQTNHCMQNHTDDIIITYIRRILTWDYWIA